MDRNSTSLLSSECMSRIVINNNNHYVSDKDNKWLTSQFFSDKLLNVIITKENGDQIKLNREEAINLANQINDVLKTEDGTE